MTERFKRAYDKLVKAYLSNDLYASICTACAIGTICNGWWEWRYLFSGGRFMNEKDWTERWPHISHTDLLVLSGYLYRTSGYRPEEAIQIERAFEGNTRIKFESYKGSLFPRNEFTGVTQSEIDQDQFNGLSAVIDVMMKLDGMDQDKAQLMQPFRQKLELA